MSHKPKSICQHPACNNLCKGTYCTTHKQTTQQRETQYRESLEVSSNKQLEARQVRGGRRWHALRNRYLCEHPWCEDPLRVHTIPVIAEEVHHKVKVSIDVDGCYDWDNLQALCRECHRRIENERL